MHAKDVVHPHQLGPAALAGDDPVECADGVVGVDPPVDLDRQRFAGVLVNDVQQLQHPPVDGGVELEIERPRVVGSLRAKPRRWCCRAADALPLALALRHPQPLLAPQPLDLLAVRHPAVLTSAGPGSPDTLLGS
jgi:hypothetical protein